MKNLLATSVLLLGLVSCAHHGNHKCCKKEAKHCELKEKKDCHKKKCDKKGEKCELKKSCESKEKEDKKS